jgi:hypothetical protein
MKRSLTVVLLACAASSFAAQPPGVIREGKAAAVLPREARVVELPVSVSKAAAKKLAVKMTIDRSQASEAVVSDPKLGIEVGLRRDGNDFEIGGYLKCHGWLLQPGLSSGGLALVGGGLNVELRPVGAGVFMLRGPYKKEDGSDGMLNLRVDAPLPLKDLTVQAPGVDLKASRSKKGYAIAGTVDQTLYGKRELAVIGGALAALTDDLFR